MLWIAAIELCDKSNSHKVNAAKLVNDTTGIFVSELYDKSSLWEEIIDNWNPVEKRLNGTVGELTLPFLGWWTVHRVMFANYYAIIQRYVAQKVVWTILVESLAVDFGTNTEPGNIEDMKMWYWSSGTDLNVVTCNRREFLKLSKSISFNKLYDKSSQWRWGILPNTSLDIFFGMSTMKNDNLINWRLRIGKWTQLPWVDCAPNVNASTKLRPDESIPRQFSISCYVTNPNF